MGVDLYAVLGLNRTCLDLDVKRAFRRAALRLHPDRVRLDLLPPALGQPPSPARPARHRDEKEFALAARAFEVLVDPELRASYDLAGETSLPPFHGDPCRTFRHFFGTDNPFLANLRCHTPSSNRLQAQAQAHRPDPLTVLTLPLRLTLEEINEGVTKVCTALVRSPLATQLGAGDTGDSPSNLYEREFIVEVAPGAPSGERYTFHRLGHQDLERQPGDVVFVLEELPHHTLIREGADLVHPSVVSLREALTGCNVVSETLDGRVLRVAITDVIRPGYEKRIKGEGLPLSQADEVVAMVQDPGDAPRGDLVLRFSVEFPEVIPRPARALIDHALDVAENVDLLRQPWLSPACRSGQAGVERAILEEKMRRESRLK